MNLLCAHSEALRFFSACATAEEVVMARGAEEIRHHTTTTMARSELERFLPFRTRSTDRASQSHNLSALPPLPLPCPGNAVKRVLAQRLAFSSTVE